MQPRAPHFADRIRSVLAQAPFITDTVVESEVFTVSADQRKRVAKATVTLAVLKVNSRD